MGRAEITALWGWTDDSGKYHPGVVEQYGAKCADAEDKAPWHQFYRSTYDIPVDLCDGCPLATRVACEQYARSTVEFSGVANGKMFRPHRDESQLDDEGNPLIRMSAEPDSINNKEEN